MAARSPRPVGVAILCFVGAPSLALAGPQAITSSTTVTSSPGYSVFVRAPRALAPVDPTATRTELDAARVRLAQQRGAELGAVVDAVAGARVLDLGGPLSRRLVTVRGGSAAQTGIVLDGITLRSPFAAGIDVGAVPLELLEGGAVVRGGQGATLGEGALTGALALRTRGQGARPFSAVSGSIGEFDTLSLGGAVGGGPIAGGASYARTGGTFPYQSELVGLPPRARIRTNNETRRATALLVHQADFTGWRWRSVGLASWRGAGVPGLADTPGQSQTASEDQGLFALRSETQLDLSALMMNIGADLHHLALEYRDPERELSSSTRFWSGGLDVAGQTSPLPGHRLWAELRGGLELAESNVYDPPRRLRGALALQDRWAYGEWLGVLALRAEFVEGQALLLMPRIGVERALGEGLHLRLGLGRSARAPSLDELYHPPEAGYVGNPELVPEAAWEVELGAQLELGPLLFGVVGFGRRLGETIIYLNRNAFAVRPENLGAATAYGLEVEATWEQPLGEAHLSTRLSGAWLQAELEATSAPLPTQPRLSGAWAIDLRIGPIVLGGAARAFSSTFVTLRPTEENVVPAYLRLDASVVLAPVGFLSVAASVVNLLDDQSLTSVQRIPLPGRTWLLTLRYASEGDPS